MNHLLPGIVVAVIGASALVAMWSAEVRATYAVTVKVSRFPLFRVRDRLVRLVAEDVVSEDETAWREAYELVTAALNPDERLPPLKFVRMLWKSRRARSRSGGSPELDAFSRRQDELAARSPAYADVLASIAPAIEAMIVSQARLRDFLVLKFVLPPFFAILDVALSGAISFFTRLQRHQATSNDVAEALTVMAAPMDKRTSIAA